MSLSAITDRSDGVEKSSLGAKSVASDMLGWERYFEGQDGKMCDEGGEWGAVFGGDAYGMMRGVDEEDTRNSGWDGKLDLDFKFGGYSRFEGKSIGMLE